MHSRRNNDNRHANVLVRHIDVTCEVLKRRPARRMRAPARPLNASVHRHSHRETTRVRYAPAAQLPGDAGSRSAQCNQRKTRLCYAVAVEARQPLAVERKQLAAENVAGGASPGDPSRAPKVAAHPSPKRE